MHPMDQISTFVSMTLSVLTSNSSGARYGIVLCSAAVSCTARASERDVIGMGEGASEPRSMRMGVVLSSASIMLPVGIASACCLRTCVLSMKRVYGKSGLPGFTSLCA